MRFNRVVRVIILLFSCAVFSCAQSPGQRVLLDAHNCYPEGGQWANRIERALSSGVPVAIEQDLYWYQDEATGRAWSVVAHNLPLTGKEPRIRDYFFERIRPVVEKALQENKRESWPLIVLNLDFKTDEQEHHAEIWNLLGEYEGWLCTAKKIATQSRVEKLDVRPVLVLTGDAESQERDFHDNIPAGSKLRLFGAARVVAGSRWDTPPEWMVPERADNYRRWWNNPWSVIEEGGQMKAGAWTREDNGRLRALVDHAHNYGYWMRFYTLDGATPERAKQFGMGNGYNFGSEEAAAERWRAAIDAGVDFVATDQYEEFAKTLTIRVHKRR